MVIGIDRFTGEWTSADGLQLHILKVDETHAKVSLLDVTGEPLRRPYWENRPTVQMPADYNDYTGEFIVHLWKADSGFWLHLEHHLSDRYIDLDEEVLSPSLSQYEDDHHLDKYHALFGNLADYKRMNKAEPAHAGHGGTCAR
jgi:hypothetical protein